MKHEEELNKAAEERYPIFWRQYPKDGIARSETEYDVFKDRRDAFIAGAKYGYEQAEKDLALTWEDVMRIVEIADMLMPFDAVDIKDLEQEFQSEEGYYKEVVLKRFNTTKNG